MALSVAPSFAWDFTSSTSPLVSKVGGAATFALNLATRNDIDGIVCSGNFHHASLPCTTHAALLGWAYPYTMIVVAKVPPTTGGSGFLPDFATRIKSDNTRLFGARLAEDEANLFTYLTNADIVYRATAPGVAFTSSVNAETVYVMEFRANGVTTHVGETLYQDVTDRTLTMPTLATTDVVVLGAYLSSAANSKYQGFALVPGALTPTDRTNLVADWRSELGIAAGSSTFRRVYY